MKLFKKIFICLLGIFILSLSFNTNLVKADDSLSSDSALNNAGILAGKTIYFDTSKTPVSDSSNPGIVLTGDFVICCNFESLPQSLNKFCLSNFTYNSFLITFWTQEDGWLMDSYTFADSFFARVDSISNYDNANMIIKEPLSLLSAIQIGESLAGKTIYFDTSRTPFKDLAEPGIIFSDTNYCITRYSSHSVVNNKFCLYNFSNQSIYDTFWTVEDGWLMDSYTFNDSSTYTVDTISNPSNANMILKEPINEQPQETEDTTPDDENNFYDDLTTFEKIILWIGVGVAAAILLKIFHVV